MIRCECSPRAIADGIDIRGMAASISAATAALKLVAKISAALAGPHRFMGWIPIVISDRGCMERRIIRSRVSSSLTASALDSKSVKGRQGHRTITMMKAYLGESIEFPH